ncbi:putative aminoglycoside phosphotransferase [Mycobacteroides abscessus subsp. abscessus]|nr:putative aminoglycoside phosphotransferase [Mycobacteroides abscessus subsp. abscessus]
MPGLPSNHSAFAQAALTSYGRDPHTPLRLLSLSENATYLVDDGIDSANMVALQTDSV